MGLFSFANDLLETASLGLIDDPLGVDAQADAINRSQQIQTEAGQEALETLRADLAPFTRVGTEAANLLLGSVLEPGGMQTTAQDVLSDPFFQALSEQQTQDTLAQRAALGLAGSGGTQDILQRNLLQLGEGFRQQRQNEALARQQTRFNQLMGATQIGQASAAQTGLTGANILTDIGTIQAQAPLAQAQQEAQFTGGLFQLGGAALGGLLGGPAGASIGAGTGGGLGAGGAVSPFGGIPSGGSPLQNFTASMTP